MPPLFRDLSDDLDDDALEPEIFLDAPFVPTDDAMVDMMLKLADLGPKDVLYDLGSGDGRIVITAAKRHRIRCIGVELDPLRVADAMEDAAYAKVEFLVDFIEEDIFEVDFSEATVITLYLLDSINVRLRPRFLAELRPGTRIISHSFEMGDWISDERLELGGVSIHKWIVPAQVAGLWEWEGLNGEIYQVDLQQKYQEVWGQAWCDEQSVSLQNAQLCGNQLDLQIQTDPASAAIHFTLHFEDGELQTIEQETQDN